MILPWSNSSNSNVSITRGKLIFRFLCCFFSLKSNVIVCEAAGILHLITSFLYSPTTWSTLVAVAVQKLGDSVVTSHEMFPLRLKSTLRSVTWLAFDTDSFLMVANKFPCVCVCLCGKKNAIKIFLLYFHSRLCFCR